MLTALNRSQPEIPFLLIGTSARLERVLRDAGIPVVVFGHDSQLTGTRTSIPGRIAFYDSRNVSSRSAVAQAEKQKLITIDIANLLDGESMPPLPDALMRLKVEVERRQGYWMRLGDYPFPFQSALCTYDAAKIGASDERRLFETFQASDPSRPLDELLGRYEAGLPLCIRQSAGVPAGVPADSPDSTDEMLAGASSKRAFPLLWITSIEQFSRWSRVRGDISFQASKQRSNYRVSPSGGFAGFRPSLELWRGNHVAVLPLAVKPSLIHEKGIVFEQALQRAPAGFRPLMQEPIQNQLARHAS